MLLYNEYESDMEILSSGSLFVIEMLANRMFFLSAPLTPLSVYFLICDVVSVIVQLRYNLTEKMKRDNKILTHM